MKKECIILAGGLGTRLQSVIKDIPKCMAIVADKPFLSHIFEYLAKERFEHVILSLGHMHSLVLDWLDKKENLPFQVSYVIENEPLGTGGAIKLAFEKTTSDNAFVINGDTYFDINTNDLISAHSENISDLTIALKPMLHFDRYGSVTINSQNKITAFKEKKHCDSGLINGGVYLINKNIFSKIKLPEKFSFEKDIMEAYVNNINIFGCVQDRYFIDIGIPSDFEKANIDFSK